MITGCWPFSKACLNYNQSIKTFSNGHLLNTQYTLELIPNIDLYGTELMFQYVTRNAIRGILGHLGKLHA